MEHSKNIVFNRSSWFLFNDSKGGNHLFNNTFIPEMGWII